MRVRAEGAVSLGAGTAGDVDPGHLLAYGDHQVRVRLVVAELHVEPRSERLDPRVLEGEGLHLGAHHGPFDARGGGDHPPGALVQGGDVLEVAGQAAAQVLGLADVDHASVLVAEAVDPGPGGDGAGRGAIGGGISHGTPRLSGAPSRASAPGTE